MELAVDGVIFESQSYGGILQIYCETLPRICELDDSVHMTLFTETGTHRCLPKHPRIRLRQIPDIRRCLRPGRLWKPIIPRARRLVRKLWIGQGRGQIWHSTYYTQPEGWSGFQVVTVADMIYELFAELFSGAGNDRFRAKKRRCVEAADAIICISETTRRDVQDVYQLSSDSIYVVPLACKGIFKLLDQEMNTSRLSHEQPFLLYIGERYHYKNFDRLVEAHSLWRYSDEVALVVVGRPWTKEEKQRLADLGISSRVHLFTDVDDETLCRLYNRAAAFVYPSLYEGFGIPLLEAMACGCPIVASHIPSTVEVAEACPIYFEPRNIESLIDAFDQALHDGRNSERVERGLDLVRDYSWDITARKTLEVYKTLLE